MQMMVEIVELGRCSPKVLVSTELIKRMFDASTEGDKRRMNLSMDNLFVFSGYRTMTMGDFI